MANKVVLPVRLDPSLIARLRELSTAIRLPVYEVICVSLDALEREQGEERRGVEAGRGRGR